MPNTIHPPKMPDGDDTWIAKGMPPKTNEEIENTPAYKALMGEWGQLDEDGIAIAVSRQALEETIEMYNQALAEKDKQREEAFIAGYKQGNNYQMNWEHLTEEEQSEVLKALTPEHLPATKTNS